MFCPVCPAAGWLGGWIGGYIGIMPSKYPAVRCFSALITANLISLTTIALKALLNVSVCSGAQSLLGKIGIAGTKMILLGFIYSIGVNYLLNRFVFPPPQPLPDSKPILNQMIVNDQPACCCPSRTIKEES